MIKAGCHGDDARFFYDLSASPDYDRRIVETFNTGIRST
jgi:hypothetical protein